MNPSLTINHSYWSPGRRQGSDAAAQVHTARGGPAVVVAAVGADDVQDDPRGVLGGWHFFGLVNDRYGIG